MFDDPPLVLLPLLRLSLTLVLGLSSSCNRCRSEAIESQRAEVAHPQQQIRNEQFRAHAEQVRQDQREAKANGAKALDERNKEFEKEGR
jgi:hypothetical protein